MNGDYLGLSVRSWILQTPSFRKAHLELCGRLASTKSEFAETQDPQDKIE